MTPRLLLLLGICLAFAGCGPQSESLQKALTGATLIDGTGAAPLPNSVVLIDGAVISGAGPEASTQIPERFEKVNVSGKFIIPGLIDANIHIESDAAKAAAEMKAFLAAGVTSVGTDDKADATGPHLFPTLGKQAGIADLVIASNGTGPNATLAKIDRLAKAEIPPSQLIQAATQSGAAWLQQTNLGTIHAGQRADLLVLNADPLASVNNLRQIYRVMLDGRWIRPAEPAK